MYYYQWPYQYCYQQPYYYCNYPYSNYYIEPANGEQWMNADQYVDYYYDETATKANYNAKNENKENNNFNVNDIPQLNGVQHFIPKVMQTLESIQQKMKEIEEENENLKEKIKDIKPINIENINYKIQELTVEELSGALNIGLSALTDAENLKKLLNENGEIKFNDLDTNMEENFEEMDG
ncbi:hypothetical protein BKP35_08155 [Anaerobacillus arseniciselenatis]|uniref:Uncharacterized protein n=1 Tax=Anaerobacillus arseniciselenatis TaxID=85682 RepID=A0A1S2LNP5_9BACI|nr:spore germination protein GerPC [Anaerobacillus arseniciselenatis]OIJ14159.1 hypothetical protein BKP35_08155 [Anaerobacillus arseniciselenatis]